MNSHVQIDHGLVYAPDGQFHKRRLLIDHGLITDHPFDDAEHVDASDLFLIPGLIDMHLHGCAGHDFCDGSADSLKEIAEYQARCGIACICPTTMTLPEKQLTDILGRLAEFRTPGKSQTEDPICGDPTGQAKIVGIRLEGPFLSAQKAGAQNRQHLTPPDVPLFLRLQEAARGGIRIADLAPECPGAFPFIETVKDQVILSFAHSTADYDLAVSAFSAGIRHVTHLYNAMNAMESRSPGPIPAAAQMSHVTAELICDGIHVHPAMVHLAIRQFGEDRIIFISDSTEATGMPDGEYRLGGQTIRKKGRRAMLPDGTIAGSVTNLMDCMRIAVREMGIPLHTAIKCASTNPARRLQIDDLYGSLAPGKQAFVVALGRDLEPVWLMEHGEIHHFSGSGKEANGF
ncbi:MAG: N-acetylglucosamine-6-phosphate deacetylase [Lachnospiraceae bacterium]|nr:N-acetylglucosamine-6-phosphate deacetylase [Lachnospiraceae bacterium]